MLEGNRAEQPQPKPLLDQLKAAHGMINDGNITPAREVVKAVAGDISNRIETGVSSTDPLAYRLHRVTLSNELGMGPQAVYLLSPSEQAQESTNLEMVYVTRGKSTISNGMRLLEQGQTNPFDKFASNRAKDIALVFGKEQAKVLEEITQVYSDILTHGITLDSNEFTVVYPAPVTSTTSGTADNYAQRSIAEYQQFVASLGFTGKLEASSTNLLAEQVARGKETYERKKVLSQARAEEQIKREAAENEIRQTRLREEREVQYKLQQEEARKKREMELATTMSYITGTIKSEEISEKMKPLDAETVIYSPKINLENGTVSLPIFQFTEAKDQTAAPFIITVPANEQPLQPAEIVIKPWGQGIGDGRDENLTYFRNDSYDNRLWHVDSLFGGLIKSGKVVELGSGLLAEVQITVGQGKNAQTILLTQAPAHMQEQARSMILQTAQKMETLYPQSPLTPALSELAKNPQPTSESSPEVRALQTGIIDILTGTKIPEKTATTKIEYELDRAHASLNYKEVNFHLNSSGEQYKRPGATRDITLRIPLGGSAFNTENVAIGINGIELATVKDLHDKALLREVQGLLGNALTNQITLSEADQLAQQMTVRAGDKLLHLQDDYRIGASLVQKVALQELITQEATYYPESPLADVLKQLVDVMQQPNPDLGPYGFMEANIERLAGSIDLEGKIVTGELLTPPLDYALLATIGINTEIDGEEEIIGDYSIAEYAKITKRGEQPSQKQTLAAMKGLRDFLTNNLFNLSKSQEYNSVTRAYEDDPRVLWLTNPDRFALQRGVMPVMRTQFDDLLRGGTRGGGTLRVEEADIEGNVPLRIDGTFSNIQIEPTLADSTVDTVYEFEMEEGKPKTDPEGQPIKTKMTGKDFKPTFKMTITEETPSGETETYTLYRVELGTDQNAEQGILIQCFSSDAPTLYTSTMVTRHIVNVTRKPIIYLYPTKPTKVKVTLDYKGLLTNTYPQINGDNWSVDASPNGTLQVKGKKYKYLFWDGVNSEIVWDWSKGFSVHKDNVEPFLEEKLEQMGLDFTEMEDFITYWSPMMKQNEWSLIAFQTEKYEELAKLLIDPKPDTLIRVFMVFKKIDRKLNIPEQQLSSIKRNGFTVVEWGGSNLDELQITQNNSKQIKPTLIEKKNSSTLSLN